jgi:serine/threonine-protein kinase
MFQKNPSQSMVGRQLGSYRIVSLIGLGGMGEVYQAHDTNLGRDVAIKVLPQAFLDDPDRSARFQREARILASLNHPNIATIYGLEQCDGVNYLVMELVPGQTLAERINVGPMKIEEAIRIAGQIAEALETAHEKGVIHRDLKPANVKVTPEGRVKVLDFGLAKAFANDSRLDLSNAPTLTGLASEEGRILGTLAYMSPEQARGKPVDKRTDNWAFGCVLYELLSGKKAFRGETPTDTLVAVLEREPDWQALPSSTPAKIRDLLCRCLQKESQRRLRDLGDARIEIEDSVIASTIAARPASPLRPLRRKAVVPTILAAGLLILAGLLVGLDFQGWRGRLFGDGASINIQSLAVLPLENFSRDPDQEYFADGMTEALITDLSKISALRVISRTSAMQYKGSKKSLPQIAKELQVDGVVEGSVERSGDRVRITAQLIQAANDKHLWAESYDRDLHDVLSLQEKVAQQIASEVRVKLTPQEQKGLTRGSPTNPEAYQLYLQGRYHWNRGTEQELKKSVEYYQQALTKDANYALAYAGLADAYSGFSDFYLAPRQVMPQAKKAAIKALEIDDTLAGAHTSLASININYDWDWSGAEREVQRAIELNPNSADAHSTYAVYLGRVGRMREFAVEIRRAEELDPLSPAIYRAGEVGYLLGRQYDRAVEQAQKAIEVQPDYFLAHTWLGVTYAQMGRLPEAVAEAEKGAQLTDSPLVHAFLGYTYAAAGKKAEARKIAEELAAKRAQRYVCPYEIGTIHLALGDRDEAFLWYEKAYEERSVCVPLMKFDPRLDAVHADPRYQDLIRRVGFPPS